MSEGEEKNKRVIVLGEKREGEEKRVVNEMPDLNLILGVSPFDTGIPWVIRPRGAPCISESQKE